MYTKIFYLHKGVKRVTIFLSVFDVHANRAPIDGKITYRHYTMGSFTCFQR